MGSPRPGLQPAAPVVRGHDPPHPAHPQRHRAHAWLGGVHSWSQELSGSLGDLGTFLPLVVALAATIQLDLGTTLVMTGLANIASGLAFRIPMCVQPMKAIASVVLAAPGAMSLSEVMAAGLFVGAVMLLAGLCGVMDVLDRAVPPAIVRGIQLAVGLQLAQKGVTQALLSSSGSWRGWWGVEGLLLGGISATLLLVTTMPPPPAATPAAAAAADQHEQQHQQQHDQRQGWVQQEDPEAVGAGEGEAQQLLLPQGRDVGGPAAVRGTHATAAAAATTDAAGATAAAAGDCGGCGSGGGSTAAVPSALVAVCVGLVLGVAAHPEVLSQLRLGPSRPRLYLPTWQDLTGGVLKAGLAQLPLTGLNSVVAVTQLAGTLFPQRAAADGWRWRPRVVAVSVGVMNLVGCWLGAVPVCHGSGGLAAQYKFGARSGAAPVLLGGLKLALGLAAGSSLLGLLSVFPAPLLGALLLASGLELAACARAEAGGRRGYALMLLTAAAILGLRSTATGFAVGVGGYAALLAYEAACGACARLWVAGRCRRQGWGSEQQQHGRRGGVVRGRVGGGGAPRADAHAQDKV